MDDFMKVILEHDFRVKFLSQNESSFLMAGFRKNHYHFIKDRPEPYNTIAQYHLPSYQLAECFEMLYETKWGAPDRPLFHQLTPYFGVLKFSGEKYSLVFGQDQYPLIEENAATFFKSIEKDIRRLKKAKKMIKWEGDHCYLEIFLTTGGRKIESEVGDNRLLEAVAFDLLQFSKLKTAPPLGIFTLFSQLVDNSYLIGDEDVKRMAEGIENWASTATMDDSWNLFDQVQQKCFTSPILGENVKFSKAKTATQFINTYHNLSHEQKVMMKTLKPNSGMTFLLCVGFVRDVISLYEFDDIVNHHLQPDSKSEQNNRYETSLLKFFGSFFKAG